MKILFIILQLMLLAGCKKNLVDMPATPNPVVTDTASLYTKYTILKGAHYCDKSMLKEFTGDHISFSVKFDSTAIYKTADPLNQEDINKLYGFSEGIDNHLNSARIGWNWNRNALRLYAYVYANGIRTSKEISKVAIGATISATIRVAGKEYLFSVDENNVALPRALNDSLVSGYRQYPYFGGDEIAPHNIYVYIRDM